MLETKYLGSEFLVDLASCYASQSFSLLGISQQKIQPPRHSFTSFYLTFEVKQPVLYE